MTTSQFLILGIIIAFNNLAVAMALGSMGHYAKRYRIILVFTGVEFVVPLLGLWMGAAVAAHIEEASRLIGPLLLMIVGIWTFAMAYREREKEDRLIRQMASWKGLIMLALILSADNLIVGFSLGLGDVSPIQLALVIAFFSGTFTWFGVWLGNRVERIWENRATALAGLLLVVLGLSDALGWM